MVEKPKQEDAPSNLIISGRYILQPEIFSLIAEQPRGAGGEIQITDAMQTLMRSQAFTGVKYKGQSFDCGGKVGFLLANVVYALDRPDLAGPFLEGLKKLDSAELALDRHADRDGVRVGRRRQRRVAVAERVIRRPARCAVDSATSSPAPAL